MTAFAEDPAGRLWVGTFGGGLHSMASDRRLDWNWRSPDMPDQLKAGIAIKPPRPQTEQLQATYATACMTP